MQSRFWRFHITTLLLVAKILAKATIKACNLDSIISPCLVNRQGKFLFRHDYEAMFPD